MKSIVLRAENLFAGCCIRANDEWCPVTHQATVDGRVVIHYRTRFGQAGFWCKPETTMLATVPNARFWVWWNDDWVKITVPCGDHVEFYHSGPTDEGYSYESQRYSHEHDRVVSECQSGGSDCDGRIDHYWTHECKLDRLRMIDEDFPVPRSAWEKVSSSQRDYAAEAAGY